MSDDKCPECGEPVEDLGGNSCQYAGDSELRRYRSTTAEQLENVKADYKAVRDGRDMLLKGVEHAQQQLADKEREIKLVEGKAMAAIIDAEELKDELTAANAVVEKIEGFKKHKEGLEHLKMLYEKKAPVKLPGYVPSLCNEMLDMIRKLQGGDRDE